MTKFIATINSVSSFKVISSYFIVIMADVTVIITMANTITEVDIAEWLANFIWMNLPFIVKEEFKPSL